jgi:hypothetical protein
MELRYLPDDADDRVYEAFKVLKSLSCDERTSALFARCTPQQLDRIARAISDYAEWRADMSERRMARLQ